MKCRCRDSLSRAEPRTSRTGMFYSGSAAENRKSSAEASPQTRCACVESETIKTSIFSFQVFVKNSCVIFRNVNTFVTVVFIGIWMVPVRSASFLFFEHQSNIKMFNKNGRGKINVWRINYSLKYGIISLRPSTLIGREPPVIFLHSVYFANFSSWFLVSWVSAASLVHAKTLETDLNAVTTLQTEIKPNCKNFQDHCVGFCSA